VGGRNSSSIPRRPGSDKRIFSSFKVKLVFSTLPVVALSLFCMLESIQARVSDEEEVLREKEASLFLSSPRRKEPTHEEKPMHVVESSRLPA
jgi:hypothetical protein